MSFEWSEEGDWVWSVGVVATLLKPSLGDDGTVRVLRWPLALTVVGSDSFKAAKGKGGDSEASFGESVLDIGPRSH